MSMIQKIEIDGKHGIFRVSCWRMRGNVQCAEVPSDFSSCPLAEEQIRDVERRGTAWTFSPVPVQ